MREKRESERIAIEKRRGEIKRKRRQRGGVRERAARKDYMIIIYIIHRKFTTIN